MTRSLANWLVVTLAVAVPQVIAPGLEDLLGQMMGGQGMPGGGQQFQFNMGGGRQGSRQTQEVEEEVEYELDCDPSYEWLRGTSWHWNNW